MTEAVDGLPITEAVDGLPITETVDGFRTPKRLTVSEHRIS
jgi:hypothetical protein